MAMKKASGDDSPLRQGAGRASEPSQTRVNDGGGYSTFHGWRLRPLGFSQESEFIGGRARSVGARGAHTMGRHGQEGAAPPLGVAGLLPISVSPLDSVNMSGK
jgi:hypothetical protein